MNSPSARTIPSSAQLRLQRLAGSLFVVVTYGLLTALFVTPLLWMIGSSLRPSPEVFQYVFPLSWRTFVPIQFTLQNFQDIFGLSEQGRTLGFQFGRALLNTAFVSTAVVGSSLVFNTLAAYFFARLDFPYKNVLLVFVLGTFFVPQEATIVPLYIVVRELGFANTYWALILPWYASPFVIFVLSQFFQEIPKELDEAAIIDGASLLGVLRYVIVPNARVGLLTVSLLEFQFIWNLFFWPLIAVGKKELQVIQVAVATQITQREIAWGRIFAGSVVASLPVILLFLALQRYFVDGVALSGLKG
ncbi:MAG: carbohydrate ABC transporter permease [Caldilineaceae bacterium]|nr:carbohydrate ABC transporter permease [Caldilineaceae bacterium]HRJ43032.1 carbohydrate ABC transporter permease [Caldilineaceae bacterium]